MNARYAAFMSYSHAADDRLAPALEAAVRAFGKAWYRQYAVRIFRDQTGLAVTPTLWDSIRAAMDESRFFILLASPEAARSEWVGREVRHWLERRPAKELLVVRTDGTIAWDDGAGDFDWSRTTALPPDLRGAFAEEPKWVDLAWARTVEHLDVRDPRFADAVADLAATLQGKPKDEIAGEEVRQYQRFRRVRQAVIIVLALAALGLGVLGLSLRRQLVVARRNLARSLAAQAATEEERHDFDSALRLTADAHATDPAEVPLDRLLLARSKGAKLLWQTPVPFEHCSGDFRLARDRNVVLGSADGFLRLWDAVDGHRIMALPQDELFARTFAVTPDARFAAAELADGSVHLYDLSGSVPAVLRTWSGLAQPSVLEIRRDGAFVAALVGDRVVVWSARSGAVAAERSLEGWGPRVIGFAPDGMLVVADAAGRGLRLDPVHEGTEERRAEPVRGEGDGPVALSPDCRRAAALVRDGRRIVVWDTRSGKLVRGVGVARELRLGGVDQIAFSTDGRFVGYAFGDGWLGRLDLRHVPARGQIVRPGGKVSAIEVLDGGQTALVSIPNPGGSDAGQTGSLRLVSLATGRPAVELTGNAGAVAAVAFDPLGRFVASGGQEGVIRLWNAADGRPERTLYGHEEAVTGVGFTPDGAHLVSTGRDGTVRVWDPTTGVESEKWDAPFVAGLDESHALAVGPRGQVAYMASDEPFTPPLLHVRRLGDPASARTLDAPSSSVRAALFDPGGELLAAVMRGGTVEQWHAESGQRLHELKEYMPDGVTSAVFPIAYSGLLVGTEGGRVVLVGSWGKTEVGSHTDPVARVAAPASGPVGISAGKDGVRVWDLPSGAALATLPGHPGGVVDAALSSDGRRLATVGADLRVRLWDIAGPLGRLPVLWRARRGDRVKGAHPAGLGIVDTSDGETVLVDLERGSFPKRLGRIEDKVTVASSADGRWLLVGTPRPGKFRVDLWDAARARRLRWMAGWRNRPDGMGFSMDSRLAFVARGDSIELFDVAAGGPPRAVHLPVTRADQVAVGPEGRFVVVRDGDGAVKAVDAGGRAVTLAATGSGTGFSATPDGEVLVNGRGLPMLASATSAHPAREITSGSRRPIGCQLGWRGPFVACAGMEDRLSVLDPASGATILDYKTAPGSASSVWWIVMGEGNGVMTTANIASNTFETWDLGPTLETYEALRTLTPEARQEWVRGLLAHEEKSRVVRWVEARARE